MHIETMEHGYVLCIDGVCRGVYRELPEKYAQLPVEDFGDKLVFPGLVDLHIHAPQYSYRGLGMDLELMDWPQVHAFPEEAKYADLEYADGAYEIFSRRLMRSATTRASIFASRHREATELLMDKLEAAGLVSYVGKVNMDSSAPDIIREPSAAESAAETEKWLENTLNKYKNTLPIITPRFIPSCSRELLEQLGQLQARYGVAVQSHLSEDLSEIQFVQEVFPETRFYGQAYDKYNLFDRTHASGAEFKPLTFDEAFYLATRGGVEFFGNTGSFEDGYEFDAVILDDSFLLHPQPMSVHERLERAVYLAADYNGLCGKYVRGRRLF